MQKHILYCQHDFWSGEQVNEPPNQSCLSDTSGEAFTAVGAFVPETLSQEVLEQKYKTRQCTIGQNSREKVEMSPMRDNDKEQTKKCNTEKSFISRAVYDHVSSWVAAISWLQVHLMKMIILPMVIPAHWFPASLAFGSFGSFPVASGLGNLTIPTQRKHCNHVYLSLHFSDKHTGVPLWAEGCLHRQ